MVFKRGDKGQGYYVDEPSRASDREFAGELSFYAAKTFCGYRKGMVFRKGDRGLGYYRDNPFGGAAIGAPCARPQRNA